MGRRARVSALAAEAKAESEQGRKRVRRNAISSKMASVADEALLVTTARACAMLSISPKLLRRLVDEGKVRRIAIGERKVLYPMESLREYTRAS